MLDQKKIALMTKLAIYDKNDGKRDRKRLQYFRHDYVYRQNMWTRFSVFIGCVILVVFYMLHRFSNDVTDVYGIDFRQEGLKLIVVYLALAGIYTFIGTVIATAEYEKSHKRLSLYVSLLHELNGNRDGAEDEIDIDSGGKKGFFHFLRKFKKESTNDTTTHRP